MTFQRTQIPRHPQWDGPLVLPEKLPRGYEQSDDGQYECKTCGGRSNKQKCPHVYYKRTTTFIDVLQSEFALKKYDRRMVAYGMSQRPDLVLAAAALRDINGNDKDALQKLADNAKEHAKASASANIGTALHSLTEDMDNGRTLGYVPEPFPADLKAYEQATKHIEWVGIESFRVRDDLKVGGTADRIGWINGRLCIADLKTSPNENPIMYPHGPAMQLAMYAHSLPYDIPTDTRTVDPADINLDTAYIISLPAGKGRCEIRPIDIASGWGACLLAVQVWKWRNTKGLIRSDDKVPGVTFADMAARAGSENELRLLWRNARDQCQLSDDLKALILARYEQIKAS